MRNQLLLLILLLNFSSVLFAQDFGGSTKDAFLITRVAEKFHLQPRPLDDSFSSHVFSQLLNLLDEDKIYFTKEDIKNLEKYKFQLDDEIKLQQSDFLKTLSNIFSQRLQNTDSTIASICKKAFDFSIKENITSDEINAYPSTLQSAQRKIYKIIKASALYKLLDEDSLPSMSAVQQKKYVDSIEPILRRKIQQNYQNDIATILNRPGGVHQYIGNIYCKAIALCYDPHTEFFPLSEKENFESELGQKSMAFGFQFKRMDDGSVQIEKVAPGSPAFKSGQINKGDKIESVQWDAQEPINVADDWQLLNKTLGLSNHGKATFRIRKQDGTIKTVTLFKEKIEDEDDESKVKSFVLNGNKKIGFISLPAFYRDWDDKNDGINGSANDIAKEILKLKKENIQGLILDLRYNGGGSMQEAVELAGIFIDAGTVAQVKGRDSTVFMLRDVNRGTMYDGPLILLVNGYSASASELLAGALQDYNRALIIGSPTYGKATAQIVLPLDTTINQQSNIDQIRNKNFLKLTISQFFRLNGNTAQATGVQPDVYVPDLSETVLSREKDQPYAIKPSTLPPAKYFRALPKMDISPLKLLARQEEDSSSYFIQLKKYIVDMKKKDTVKTLSLRFSDALSQRKNAAKEFVTTDTINTTNAYFSVDNNAFEKQQLFSNASLKEMNDQWILFLLRDPQLRVAYNIISSMIQK